MFRPCDWVPLAEADPLPGDPDAIAAEAARLVRLGQDMRVQSARLRQIGADSTLIGAYADELRSAAGTLAGDLDESAERYERVGSALSGWAPELAEAQRVTLQARTKAIAAEELRLGGPAATAPTQRALEIAPRWPAHRRTRPRPLSYA